MTNTALKNQHTNKPLKVKKDKKDLYQEVTDQILELMEKTGSDWSKSWVGAGQPVNIASGKNYNGINVLLLGMAALNNSFSSSHWGTYKQWAEKGGQVKKGSKGTTAVFFKAWSITEEVNGEDQEKTIPILKSFKLFNADQIDGIELEEYTPFNADNSKIEQAENVLINSGATINHGGGSAFYAPSKDLIQMPELNSFFTSVDYYGTAFHELTHWTANKKRLDRDLSGRFGDESYAMEELIAEIGAAFLCAHTEIESSPRADHAKYLNSWMDVLKQDKKAIFTAASNAQKATDYILSLGVNAHD